MAFPLTAKLLMVTMLTRAHNHKPKDTPNLQQLPPDKMKLNSYPRQPNLFKIYYNKNTKG